jgi:excisionase family DNA binding protein
MLTTKQVAEHLGCSVKHVRELYKIRAIVPISIGIKRRALRVSQEELDRYKEAARVQSTPKKRKTREYVATYL